MRKALVFILPIIILGAILIAQMLSRKAANLTPPAPTLAQPVAGLTPTPILPVASARQAWPGAIPSLALVYIGAQDISPTGQASHWAAQMRGQGLWNVGASRQGVYDAAGRYAANAYFSPGYVLPVGDDWTDSPKPVELALMVCGRSNPQVLHAELYVEAWHGQDIPIWHVGVRGEQDRGGSLCAVRFNARNNYMLDITGAPQ